MTSMNGQILIGPNEKMTAFGDLAMTAEDGDLTFGDLNVVGDLALAAGGDGTIRIRSREAGELLLINVTWSKTSAPRSLSAATSPLMATRKCSPQMPTILTRSLWLAARRTASPAPDSMWSKVKRLTRTILSVDRRSLTSASLTTAMTVVGPAVLVARRSG